MKLLFLLQFLLLFFFSCSSSKNNNIRWKYTTGRITGGGDKFPYIIYFVNGKQYIESFHPSPEGLRDDEIYPLYYDSMNHKEIICETWNPQFLNTEKTFKSVGKIEKIYWYGINMYAIRFSVKVGSRIINRGQNLPSDFRQKYPKLKKGQCFEVEIWNDDIYRVIIYLNSPLASASDEGS